MKVALFMNPVVPAAAAGPAARLAGAAGAERGESGLAQLFADTFSKLEGTTTQLDGEFATEDLPVSDVAVNNPAEAILPGQNMPANLPGLTRAAAQPSLAATEDFISVAGGEDMPAQAFNASLVGRLTSQMDAKAGLLQRPAGEAGMISPPVIASTEASRVISESPAVASPPKAVVARAAIAERSPVAAAETTVVGTSIAVTHPGMKQTVLAAAPAVESPRLATEQGRHPLVEALGDRLRVEIGKRSEQAVIRLDPPMMGSIEVLIRHQGGVLQVQLSATHSEVLRQLQNISESLRQDLAQRQYTDVSVQIFSGSRDSDGRQRPADLPEEKQPGRALAEAETDLPPSTFVLSPESD